VTASIHHTVSSEEAGQRLDRLLVLLLQELSRGQIQQHIEDGSLQLNGHIVKSSQKLKPGDIITGTLPEAKPSSLIPEAIPLAVLYEDDDLMVVEKPAGMVVHPGSGIRTGTLANALLHHLGSSLSKIGTLRPGIVHRLDKGTSGLLVIAKNEFTHNTLAEKFKSREVEKVYLTMVHGTPRRIEDWIDAPIGRDPVHRTRMSLRSSRPRPALTEYEVLESWGDFSLLRVRIRTGRTHQIRVHLSSLGHPVVGDTTYGSNRYKMTSNAAKRSAIDKLNRLFLHACFLKFTHPRTGESMQFESPLPPELEALHILLQ
jgi:23S rRNA pseudouridine1911/1915/1917 synthase